MSGFKTLDDLPEDLTGKKVHVRVDLNVPMEGAKVTDDTRLRAMLPTVLELSDRGAIVLLLSHFGRPKGEKRPDMSTAQLVLPIHRLAGRSPPCCRATSASSRTRDSTLAKSRMILSWPRAWRR